MRRIAIAATAAAFLLPALAGTATAVPNDKCEPGEWCLYENYDYGGDKYQWTYDDIDYTYNYWVGTSDDLVDEASSAKNRTGCWVYLYSSPDWIGNNARFPAGQEEDDLGTRHVRNDNASSHDIRCG